MADTWMTVPEAASALRCHTRTIERRIASGKIQARRADDGQLQVLLDLPDNPDQASDTALETVRELAADQVTLATGSASALVKFARDDANRARNELDIVRQEATRARRTALAAWLVVAGLSVAVTIAVGWTASRITRANADVRQLTDYARKIESDTAKLQTERDIARQSAQAAQIAAADTAGRLAAYVEQNERLAMVSDTRPTTRPSNVMQRLAQALAD